MNKNKASLQMRLLNYFGIDKWLHLFAGAIILDKARAVCQALGLPYWRELLIALLVVLLAGIFKELVYDVWMRKGKFDPLDVLATIAGVPFSIAINAILVLPIFLAGLLK